MSGDKATLLDFGFSEARVNKALRETKNAGLQPALDWLEKHADDPEPTDEPAASGGGDVEMTDADAAKLAEAEAAPADATADGAGKASSAYNAASASATLPSRASSGHDQFEESTEEIAPLTEAEKKAKLEELRAAMQLKRAAREKQDAADAKQNEALRRKSGRELNDIKAEMKLREAEKEAAQRKKDKLEEAKAKARVKAQIEADKKARADKLAADKAARAGLPPPTSVAAAGPSTVSQTKVSSGSTPSTNTRLQLRLPTGTPVTTTLPSSERLASVADFLRKEHGWEGSISFSTTFPRKMFTAAEMAKTLSELGLSPSCVLVVQP